MLYNNYRIGDNMKKNGFTLVELIAVVSILAMILVITLPSMFKSIKNNKQSSLDRIKDIVVAAARDYAIDNDIEGPTTISLTTLCDANYIECPIINPVTETNLTGSVNISSSNNFTFVN